MHTQVPTQVLLLPLVLYLAATIEENKADKLSAGSVSDKWIRGRDNALHVQMQRRYSPISAPCEQSFSDSELLCKQNQSDGVLLLLAA
jgi:hypothetical protein